MIKPELIVKIRHLYFAEHWKIGTIASELGLHQDTIRHAIDSRQFNRARRERVMRLLEPYVPFVEATLKEYPRLRATRIFQMIRLRGYTGSLCQLRRLVASLRLPKREAFLRLRTFPGEQGQADWAHFGKVTVGRARRWLSCFVIALSYSRRLWGRFFFDQGLENFLLGHVEAFSAFKGTPRIMLYDNLKSAVLARRGDAVQFHPRLLELAAHYHFAPRPCRPARGNEKGRVERAIQYIRSSFFAARPFTSLEDLNRQLQVWLEEVADQRKWVQDDSRSVGEVFREEQPLLLSLPAHPFETDLLIPICSRKTIYVRFDLNDYSIPPDAVDQPLTLAASPDQIRILDSGGAQIASHRRCWDRHQVVEDPAHRQALLEEKRRALGSSPSGRLSMAVPESETLLNLAFQRGESIGRSTTHLLELLDDYGADDLRWAIAMALGRDTPRVSSVAFLLRQRRRSQQGPAPRPVSLDRRPDLADLHVQPHDSETYDELFKNNKRNAGDRSDDHGDD